MNREDIARDADLTSIIDRARRTINSANDPTSATALQEQQAYAQIAIAECLLALVLELQELRNEFAIFSRQGFGP